MVSENSIDEPSRLTEVEEGRLMEAVGFEKYARRVYSTVQPGSVSISIATLLDFRAAYSLLTLIRNSDIKEGPPGDAFAENSTGIEFSQGRHWVRIEGKNATAGLLLRLALSVSNRLGPRGQKPPSLIKHLPETGCDASSLKYFPGLRSFESYSGTRMLKSLRLDEDAEIAQARYKLNTETATLTLLSFPTPEVGEDYFNKLSSSPPGIARDQRAYIKRAGPLVAVLTGDMPPRSADKILASISHSYAIRWIYEKPQKTGITWGIPVRILQTVAKSMLFVMLLSIVAVVLGITFGILRLAKRRRLLKNNRVDRNRLKLFD